MPINFLLAVCGLVLATLGWASPTLARDGNDDSRTTLRERIMERIAERRRDERQQDIQGRDDRASSLPITGAGDYTRTLIHDGQTRLYRVHVPATYSATRPTPIVLSLHGGGGSMDYQADDMYYGQIAKSEQTGVIAVFPNGVSKFANGQLATWNAGHCCGSARDQGSDDVGFIRALIKDLRGHLNIDPQRIFANGMSNGGMMAYRLACEMPDVIKAIAAVAGTDNTRQCSPAKPVSVLHIHARNDELVLFEGGAGRKSDKITEFVAVPVSIAKWVEHNGCAATPTRVFAQAGAYCDVYAPCRAGTEVKLCVTADGGHSWPGGKKPRAGDRAPSTALSATDVIGDFFGHQP